MHQLPSLWKKVMNCYYQLRQGNNVKQQDIQFPFCAGRQKAINLQSCMENELEDHENWIQKYTCANDILCESLLLFEQDNEYDLDTRRNFISTSHAEMICVYVAVVNDLAVKWSTGVWIFWEASWTFKVL